MLVVLLVRSIVFGDVQMKLWLKTKLFIAYVIFYDASKNISLKINVSETMIIMFDQRNGMNNCNVYA